MGTLDIVITILRSIPERVQLALIVSGLIIFVLVGCKPSVGDNFLSFVRKFRSLFREKRRSSRPPSESDEQSDDSI